MPTAEISVRVTLKNVLFATDFSPAAENALRYAGELARHAKAKLYAVHVQAPPNYALPPQSWKGTAEATEFQARELKVKLENAFPEVESEVIVREGVPWRVLASLAEEMRIDLIVLGTRGRTGVEKFLLGSQAAEILRHAPCPVLVAGPYSYWSEHGGQKVAEILYATGFGFTAQEAAAYAVSFAEEYQSNLTLLHVIAEPRAGEFVNASQLVEACARKMRDLVPGPEDLPKEPSFLVEQGPAAEKILEVAERIHADLIVLGAHEASGFPGAATHLPISVAHKVIAQANCPVLAIPSVEEHTAT
jgi:nucleotide-binding universal stress UspA family protein